MEDRSDSLKQFREEIYPLLISKGLKPPTPDSAHENEMYRLWLSDPLDSDSNEATHD